MNEEYRYIVVSFLPEIALTVLALLVLAVDLLLPKRNLRRVLVLVAAFGCLAVAAISGWQWLNTGPNLAPAFVQREIQPLAAQALQFTPSAPATHTHQAGTPHRSETPEGILRTAFTEPAGSMINSLARDTVFAYRAIQKTHPALPNLAIGLAHPGVAVWWFFAIDQFAAAFKVIFALAAFLVLLLSIRYPVEKYRAEFAALIMFATVGLMVMVNSLDLVVLFLGLELASLCLYALASWHKEDARSSEAGMKYLLLGSLASAIFIFGTSLFFVQFGSTHLSLLAHGMTLGTPLALIAFLMILVGFGFKIAAAPFHVWAPDVYEGAPTSLTAFLSTASKAAGFAVLLRTLGTGFLGISGKWWLLVAVMAALSMLIGNLVAIHQNNVKRMLAYSGIAQAGYVLLGVMAMGLAHVRHSAKPLLGITAVILYLFLYTVGNIGAFAVTGIVARETGSEDMSAFAGLRWRAPLLAFGMTLLLLSLGGIPMLAGFVGKWFLFYAGVYEGQYLLVLLGAALSVVSIYYYLLVIKQMYIIPAASDAKPIRVGAIAGLGLLVIVLLTVFIGVYPKPFFNLAQLTAQSLQW